MAKSLQKITMGAPGFYGLNTEISPVEMPPQFAQVANNCIIDNYGRLGARKGFQTQSASVEDLGGEEVKRVFEWTSSGSTVLFAVGNNKIFRVDTTTNPNDTLTELGLPMSYSITGDNWDFCDFNGEAYFFQAGHAPLLCNSTLNGTDDLDSLDNQSGESSPDAPEGNIVLAAYGRLWTAGDTAAPSTVYWSDTLIGDGWTEGASGSIDVNTYWPNGFDTVQGLAFHNGYLIIFGMNSILLYSGADDPANDLALRDTVAGTGCVARDSIQHTGSDVLFLSSTGVRTLGRTLEQSSIPIGEVTQNVRTELIFQVNMESTGINSVYSPEEGFYLLIFEESNHVYCIDMQQVLENGARRITYWPGTIFNCFCRQSDGTLLTGGISGVGVYNGYLDDDESYRYQYYSPALTFGSQGNIKIVKKINPIMIGPSGAAVSVFWGYGYSSSFSSEVVYLSGGGSAEYGVGEYGISEYSSGIIVNDRTLNTTGAGEEVTIGIELDINGSRFSLQQISVLALIGRIV